ncbi:HD-GYP domain-containing protein [Clostridiaceae bacterium HSG29]|nr:HD-GYP domain-containing protein [Clostridiaceae bacterium HSG29]
MMKDNKNKIKLVEGFFLGSSVLTFFSAIQKFFSYNKIVLDIKLYIVPILFGGITGMIIMNLFIKRKKLSDEIRKDYDAMKGQKLEIEALYSQLEAHSQTIELLNRNLNLTLEKYEIIIDSTSNFSVLKNRSEEEFLSEIYNVAQKIIKKFDYGVVFTFENGKVKPIKSCGYNLEKLKKFELSESIVKVVYTGTNIYHLKDISVGLMMSNDRFEEFKKINPNSKEILYLCIKFQEKVIGGLFLELDAKNIEAYDENDLKVMKTFQSIVESYYESIAYEELEGDRLLDIVKAMTNMLEFHDVYTKGHSLGVADISAKIGKELKMSAKDIRELYLTGLLHDIGKTFIPYELLNKNGKLTDQEFEIIKKHPSNGEKVLHAIKSFEKIRLSVKHHHERWDGKGYPDGLKGNEISFETQIISVADAYDAMTTDRPYREAMSKEDAILEIKNSCGKQFSPEICKLFVNMLKNTPDK